MIEKSCQSARISYIRLFPLYSRNKCIDCSNCATLCPFANINIIDKKPIWSNTCTHCMDCIDNCPTKAIEYDDITKDKQRYHFHYRIEEIENKNYYFLHYILKRRCL